MLLAISVKTVNFRDLKTKNFQKNLVNRRGDMLIERYVFIGRDFADDEEARIAGKKFSAALLLTGAIGNLGVDIGVDRATLQFSDEIHAAKRQETGKELRGEMFGLMTYKTDTVTINRLDAQLFGSVSVQSIQTLMTPWLNVTQSLSERQRICAALMNDTFFTLNTEAQFILYISAVEALCDQADVGEDYRVLIDELLETLSTMTAREDARESARRMLQYARKQSLRQSYMAKLRSFLGEARAKEFDELYQLRSSLVHDGKGRGDLQSPTVKAQSIAIELLKAELESIART